MIGVGHASLFIAEIVRFMRRVHYCATVRFLCDKAGSGTGLDLRSHCVLAGQCRLCGRSVIVRLSVIVRRGRLRIWFAFESGWHYLMERVAKKWGMTPKNGCDQTLSECKGRNRADRCVIERRCAAMTQSARIVCRAKSSGLKMAACGHSRQRRRPMPQSLFS